MHRPQWTELLEEIRPSDEVARTLVVFEQSRRIDVLVTADTVFEQRELRVGCEIEIVIKSALPDALSVDMWVEDRHKDV